MIRRPRRSTLFPYTTLFGSAEEPDDRRNRGRRDQHHPDLLRRPAWPDRRRRRDSRRDPRRGKAVHALVPPRLGHRKPPVHAARTRGAFPFVEMKCGRASSNGGTLALAGIWPAKPSDLSFEESFTSAFNLFNLVVRKTTRPRSEIATLELLDFRSADRPIPSRPGPVPIDDDRVGEATRLSPAQFVQDLPRGPTHSGVASRAEVFAFAAQKPYRADRLRGPMDYPPRVRAVLDRAKADQGDTVLVLAKGERYEGTLMPHHGFSGEDILTVKLPNGYNIGIAVADGESVDVTAT